MQNNHKAVQIEFTPEFKRNIRHLSKKYRHIKSDIQEVIKELETGHTRRDQIKNAGFTVYKVRAKNRDIKKEKRSGYRIIYYVQTTFKYILVTIYSKTEQGDITNNKISHIIAKFIESLK